MIDQKKFLDLLGLAIKGIHDDSIELMKLAEISKARLSEVTLADHEESNGLVTMPRHDFAVLSIGAAIGAADNARELLDDGLILEAASLAIAGQRTLSSAAGALLGISIGKAKEPLKRFAQSGANARHNRPGGAREKHKLIRDAWATGKYGSRDICAEQEAAALGMSFSAARKALRGTPDPT